MSISRKQAEKTLKVLVRYLESRYEKDDAWTTRFKSGDDSSLEEILSLACQETGVAQNDYENAFENFPDLRQQQKQLICDALLRPLNPGPNNPRARESLGARVPIRTRPWWKFW